MFRLTKPNEVEKHLDREVVRLLKELNSHMPGSEEFGEITERLNKLHKMRQEEKPKLVSPDTVLIVASNILGIVLMTRYEKEHVITSKALTFIRPPKL